MTKLFVYETLKDKHTLMKALHEKHAHELTPTTLQGYKEVWPIYNGRKWPNIIFVGHDHDVSGDLVDVNPHELKELDSWEDNYKRSQVDTDHGKAYTYIFRGSY